MAYTVTKVVETCFGDQRVRTFDVTADAATQTIQTGLQYVNFCQVTALSMTTTTDPKIAVNVSASGVAANGSIAVTTCISGDHFFLTVYGR